MYEGNWNTVISVVASLRLGQSKVWAPAREKIYPKPLDSFGSHKASYSNGTRGPSHGNKKQNVSYA